MNKKLYRSRDNRMIAGVCGGIAEYFDVDPTMIRLAAAILLIVTNVPIFIAYIICAIVIPEGSYQMNDYDDYPNYTDEEGRYNNHDEYNNYDDYNSYNSYNNQQESYQKKKTSQRFIAIGMIIIGGILLVDQSLSWISTSTFWSLAIMGCGGFMLLNSRNKQEHL